MTNLMTIYDVLCQWNKETEIVIKKCRKLSWTPPLRTMSLCAQAGQLPAHALMLLTETSPGEFGKLHVGRVT